MQDFRHKVVVVTGAASGMGRAYATAFAQLGAKLALCDIDEKGLQQTLFEISQCSDATVYSELFSVSDEQAVYAFADNVNNHFGQVNLVINNAGIEGGTDAGWKIDTDIFKRVINVNFYGVVYCSRAFLPHLFNANEAILLNVSSVFGLAGIPGCSDYCASKFAVRGFTESLMGELINSHVKVMLLHPGGIKTNITRNEDSKRFAKTTLTTDPDDIVRFVIKALAKNNPRLVYGNKSTLLQLLSNFVPLKWRLYLLLDQIPKSIKKKFVIDPGGGK